MKNNLTISKIFKVFDGELDPGTIKERGVGRYSDCFVYFLSGNTEYFFNDYSFMPSPGDVIFLAKNSFYKINVLHKCKFICIDFDFIENSKPQKSDIFKGVPLSLKNEFLKAFYTWNKKCVTYLSQSFSILYGIYATLLECKNKKYAKTSDSFSLIASYVIENYTDPNFSVNKISEYMGLSEMQIRRIFKSTINYSPIKYINFLRFEKAKNMLSFSNYSISEIAKSAGFSDPYYFSRFFKKITGLSPTEYRINNFNGF